MISKPIPADSFYHTCRYICQKPGAEVLMVDGVRGYNYKVMAEDFIRQQQLRPAKEKACFHSILSFHPTERPSDEIMKEIARKYLEQLGIVNTQFSVTKHTDRAHPHLHVVANMVDNNGKAISDSWIGLRGKKVAQQLTEEYNLIPAIKKDLALTHVEAMNEAEANKYRIYQAITENLPHCRTMEELERRLLDQGIEIQYKYKGQTEEKQGISFRMGEACFKGSQVDRKYSLSGLEKAIEHQQKQSEIPQLIQDQEQIQLRRRKTKMSSPPSQTTLDRQSSIDANQDLGQGLAKVMQILMRPEEETAYNFSNEAEVKRRKKKKQRPR